MNPVAQVTWSYQLGGSWLNNKNVFFFLYIFFFVFRHTNIQKLWWGNCALFKRYWTLNISFIITPSSLQVRVGAIAFSTKSTIAFKLNEYSEKKPLQERISDIDYKKGWTYTNRALEMLRTELLNDKNTRPGIPKYNTSTSFLNWQNRYYM